MVSIFVVLCFHWMQILTGLNLGAKVLGPSFAIAAMMYMKVPNPPAAAAAFIFLINDKRI